MALTATATENVREDIVRFLGLRDPDVVAGSPHRANLAFEVLHSRGDARLRALIRFARRLRRPGIIYCSTTREVDNVYTRAADAAHPGAPLPRQDGRQRPQPSAGDVHEDRAAHRHGGDQRLRPRHRQARHPLHRPLPVAGLARAVRAGGGPRRPRRAEGELHPALRRGRPRHPRGVAAEEPRASGPALQARHARWRRGRARAARPTSRRWRCRRRQGRASPPRCSRCSRRPGWSRSARTARSRSSRPPSRSRSSRAASPDSSRPCARRTAGASTRIGEYALTRSVAPCFLRRYFGEEDGTPCGLCDICRGRPERPSSFWEPIAQPERKKKRRRRGRRRSAGPIRPSAAPVAPTAGPRAEAPEQSDVPETTGEALGWGEGDSDS